MVGFALFGSVHILPAYLAEAGATMPSISAVLARTGLPQLLLKAIRAAHGLGYRFPLADRSLTEAWPTRFA
jgi:hypothetical protein